MVAFLVSSFRQPAETGSLLPASSSGVVVLDVSASISSDTYARIAATLDRLIRSKGSYGLILFSDTAYQALPPNTPARELEPLLRFFDVPQETSPGSACRRRRGARGRMPSAPAPGSPPGSRSRSTSSARSGCSHPAVLLVSDLDDDSGDVDRVSQAAIAYRRAGIPLHVVGLNASPEDAAFIRRFVTGKGSFEQAALPSERAWFLEREGRPKARRAGGAGCSSALGGFLLLAEPLRWRAS